MSAPYRCDPPQFNPQTRDLLVCFSGLDQPSSFNGTQIKIQCLDNCSGLKNPTTILSGYDHCADSSSPTCASCGQDCYYSCYTFNSLDRGVGKINVSYKFADGGTCVSDEVLTDPQDRNPRLENRPPSPISAFTITPMLTPTPLPGGLNQTTLIFLYAIIGVVIVTIPIIILNLVGINPLRLPKIKP